MTGSRPSHRPALMTSPALRRHDGWGRSIVAAIVLGSSSALAACMPTDESDAIGAREDAVAVTSAFQDGVAPSATYKGTRDTYLSQNAPNTNYGAATSDRTDGDDPSGTGKDLETIILWDISSIPAGSTIKTVSVSVNITNASSDGYHVYPLETAWSETQATWNQRLTGTAWQVAGAKGSGDRGGTSLATIQAGTKGSYSFALNSAGLAVVQSWLDDPSTNHGLIIAGATTTDGIAWSSRESSTASHRSKLLVGYDPPSACTPATCASLGKNCGTIADGCGNTISCGTCTAPETCGGGGVGNVCGTSPLDLLYVIDQSRMSDAEVVMIQSLQGILAQADPRIWIQGGISSAFLSDLQARHGVTVQTATDPWSLVQTFKTELTGYVLYDLFADSENVASSLAGIKKALAVDAGIQSKAASLGLSLIEDVRGRDEAWALSHYGSAFAKGIFVEQAEAAPTDGYLRDLAAARSAFVFYDGGTSTFRTTVARTLGPDAVAFGWGGDCCEKSWVTGLSAGQASGVASNYSRDLSVLEWAKEPDLSQLSHHTPTIEDGVHYVAFVMSDGDNLQWLEHDFGTSTRWWGSPYRGTFNMTWEMAPILADVAPSILRYFELQAKTGASGRDFFVSGPSGHGYMFPSRYVDSTNTVALGGFIAKLEPLIEASDLHIVSILNDGGGMEVCDPYLASNHVVGAIYKDFSDYNAKLGAIRWSSGKPCIAYRYLLWDNGSAEDSPSGVAASLASRPRAPLTDPGSYSLVQVHAWSSWGGNGAMWAAASTVGQLPSAVRVVTAEDLFVLMRKQFGAPVP